MLHIAYGQGSISKIFLMKIRHGRFYMHLKSQQLGGRERRIALSLRSVWAVYGTLPLIFLL